MYEYYSDNKDNSLQFIGIQHYGIFISYFTQYIYSLSVYMFDFFDTCEEHWILILKVQQLSNLKQNNNVHQSNIVSEL